MGSPFWFFQVYCTIIKTYSGWFVNCVLFKSSVSDIIVTHKDNETHAFYVQPIGYKQVDNLLPELENATPSKAEQHER